MEHFRDRYSAVLERGVTGKVMAGAICVALVCLSLITDDPAKATPAEASTGLKRPLEVTMKVSGWCDNTGSDINLVGDLSLGSVAMKITLANNRKGTHSVGVDTVADVVVSPANENAVFQKAPAFGGVTGNPHAVLELTDTSGATLTNNEGDPLTYYLGRCVTGAKRSSWSATVNENLTVDGGLDTLVQALECSQKGSHISVKGSAFNEGVDANLILANQVNKVPGEPGVHWDDVEAEVSVNLLPEIARHKGWWDKEAGIHGPGGNPLVYEKLTDLGVWNPKLESSWGLALGRCNKLT